MAYWLAIEALRLARICIYERTSERKRWFSQVTVMWNHKGRTTLYEILDILEFCDFVHRFLSHKIFVDVYSFSNWVEGDPHWEEYLGGTESEVQKWLFFVRSTGMYLRPPNIIVTSAVFVGSF
jgi:hypothetical protein